MKKTMAFKLTVILIMAMFVLMVMLQYFDKAAGFPIGHFLTAIVSIGSCYIGLEVANNGVKGKCWNQDFYNAENKEGDKNDRTDK